MVDAFEAEVAERVGVGRGVALSSGTAALHLALLDVGARPGRRRHRPVDDLRRDRQRHRLHRRGAGLRRLRRPRRERRPGAARDALEHARGPRAGRRGRRARSTCSARCADHAASSRGWRERGVPVVEDAAESLGLAATGGRPGPSAAPPRCRSTATRSSPPPAAACCSPTTLDLPARARHLATQAREPAPCTTSTPRSATTTGCPTSSPPSAVAQLARLDEMIGRRRGIRDRYRGGAGRRSPGLRRARADAAAADDQRQLLAHLVLVDAPLTASSPDEPVAHLAEADIEARPSGSRCTSSRSSPTGGPSPTAPSERLFRTGLALPSGSALTDDEFVRVIRAVLESCAAATLAGVTAGA